MPDLPSYLASGASSRAHHAFLVKLHRAVSEQEEDDVIDAEVERCRGLLSGRPGLWTIAETLVILLHCETSRRRYRRIHKQGQPDQDWALVAALQLAERGRDVREKRLGYLYLTEAMPSMHELRLMLINTIRKDLASNITPYKLLALHTIVKLPSADLGPAVTPLLTGKVFTKHPEAAVRQRTLEALLALHFRIPHTSNEPFPLSMSKILRLLAAEEDLGVVAVLLGLVRELVNTSDTHPSAAERAYLFQRLTEILSKLGSGSQVALSALRAIRAVCEAGGSAEEEEEIDLSALDETVCRALTDVLVAQGGRGGFLFEVCHLPCLHRMTQSVNACLRAISSLLVPETASSTSTSTSAALPSSNDHILALRCLTVLPMHLWDKRLGETEMGVIMKGLECDDDSVRRATVRLLVKAVPSIPVQTFSNYLTSLATHSDLILPPNLDPDLDVGRRVDVALRETASRALEVIEVICEGDEDGGRAADMVHALLETCAPESGIWEEGARRVLDGLAHRSTDFQQSFSQRIVSLPPAPSHALLIVRAEVSCLFINEPEAGIVDALIQDLALANDADTQRCSMAAIVFNVSRLPEKADGVERLSSILRGTTLSKGIRPLAESVLEIIDASALHLISSQVREMTETTIEHVLEAIRLVASSLKRERNPQVPILPTIEPSSRSMVMSQLRYDPYESPKSGGRKGRRKEDGVVLFDESQLRSVSVVSDT